MQHKQTAFTLIELAIVMVIIGLIIGGVLVGRDLISAAATRAQIGQIEKYKAAVNTFRVKYGYLPGDIPNSEASTFGFVARSTGRGMGDGNGILENSDYFFPPASGWPSTNPGELTQFWCDLATAKLVESDCSAMYTINAFPAAKINDISSINVISGGWSLSGSTRSDGKNYFLLARQFINEDGNLAEDTSITTAQAYAIDKKADDGMPQYGKIMALIANPGFSTIWASGNKTSSGIMAGGQSGASNSPLDLGNATSVSPSDTTCYDTRGNTGVRAEYSFQWNNGLLPNCSLAFRFD